MQALLNKVLQEDDSVQTIDDVFQVNTLRGLDILSILSEVYTKNLPLIRSIVKRYVKLETSNDMDDFLQQAYVALYDAMIAYRQDSTGTKFSTIFVWYLQKSCERLCPMNEKQVELIYPDGSSKIIAYKKYLKIKRQLPDDITAKITSLYVSFDQLNDEQGEKDYG